MERGEIEKKEGGRVSFNTVWMVTLPLTHHTPLHSHITNHSTHTCTAFARLPLSNLDSNTSIVLSGGMVGVALGVVLGPARARVNCIKETNHQLLT